jgi:hypothetical protein
MRSDSRQCLQVLVSIPEGRVSFMFSAWRALFVHEWRWRVFKFKPDHGSIRCALRNGVVFWCRT